MMESITMSQEFYKNGCEPNWQFSHWRESRTRSVLALVTLMFVVEAEQLHSKPLPDLKPILKIDWRLGPDYPMGIQDSAVGEIDGKLVSSGGFTRHPLD